MKLFVDVEVRRWELRPKRSNAAYYPIGPCGLMLDPLWLMGWYWSR